MRDRITEPARIASGRSETVGHDLKSAIMSADALLRPDAPLDGADRAAPRRRKAERGPRPRLQQVHHRNWGKRFRRGQFPREFESCDRDREHRGKQPRYWRYVRHSACHWLVNFNLRLARLVKPKRPGRIVTSEKHSTVWDNKDTVFDFNFLAFGIPADECFALADEHRLPTGMEYRVGRPVPWGRAA